jgi:hypothetical protein
MLVQIWDGGGRREAEKLAQLDLSETSAVRVFWK